MIKTVFLDACVLYPAYLRDILCQLAYDDLFVIKWSERVHQEWIRNLFKNRPDIREESLVRLKNKMIDSFMDSLVEDFEDIEKELNLPDKDDNHVLAAAIKSNSKVIVTANIKDFPNDLLSNYNILAQHPDDFLVTLANLHKSEFLSSLKTIRARMKTPKMSAQEYCKSLSKYEIPKTVEFLLLNISSI